MLKVEKIDSASASLFDTRRQHIIIFAVCFVLLLTRRPDAILNAQFWAEDGKDWYANAYNLGAVKSLFMAHDGYFQTISRITASIAQAFPLIWAPLIFNIVALIFEILPVNLILSSRFSEVIPNKSARLLLAFLYIALPNSVEVHANLTNAQWHLALLACMVVLAEPSDHKGWQRFDLATVALSALSGPFSILLAPVALMRWIIRRERWIFYLCLLLLGGALIQAFAFFFIQPSVRPQIALGATPQLFSRIIGGQIFLSALIGQSGYGRLISHAAWKDIYTVLITLTGFVLILYSSLTASLELRLFILFAASIIAGALISPAVTETVPQWQIMWLPKVGGRYWFIPMICFIATLIYLQRAATPRALRIIAASALLLMPVGIIRDWKYPPMPDLEFKSYAEKLREVPQGSVVTIPINPPGWSAKLIKH